MNSKHSKALGSILATVAAVSLFWIAPGTAYAQDRIDVVSGKNFAATVNALTTALKQEGMMVVASIDHQNMLKMVGASIKGAKTIEFGKPDMGKMLLPMAPEVALEMPGKIYVWERSDGKTVLSYRKVAPAYASYGKPQIADAGNMMDMMAEKLMNAAAH